MTKICFAIILWTLLTKKTFYVDRGLRSKRIKRIEHHLAANLKETQRKIWNGVTKDVSYLRKILNEVYFLKFKVREGHNLLQEVEVHYLKLSWNGKSSEVHYEI